MFSGILKKNGFELSDKGLSMMTYTDGNIDIHISYGTSMRYTKGMKDLSYSMAENYVIVKDKIITSSQEELKMFLKSYNRDKIIKGLDD